MLSAKWQPFCLGLNVLSIFMLYEWPPNYTVNSSEDLVTYTLYHNLLHMYSIYPHFPVAYVKNGDDLTERNGVK